MCAHLTVRLPPVPSPQHHPLILRCPAGASKDRGHRRPTSHYTPSALALRGSLALPPQGEGFRCATPSCRGALPKAEPRCVRPHPPLPCRASPPQGGEISPALPSCPPPTTQDPATDHPTPAHQPYPPAPTNPKSAHPSSASSPAVRQAGNAAGGRSPPLRGRCRHSRQRGVTACDHRKNRGSSAAFPLQKQQTAAQFIPAPAPCPILSPSRHRLHRSALPARRGRCPGGAVETRAAFPGPGMKGLPLA